MKIDIAEEVSHALADKVAQYIDAQAREGIHASDLSAPLRAYWKHKVPLPSTRREQGYWITGLAHHFHTVQALEGINDTDSGSQYSKTLGIYYSPDLLSIKGEIKTSRLALAPRDEEQAKKWFHHYMYQCCTYAVAEKVNYWYLYVLFLCPLDFTTKEKMAPFVMVYKLTWTKMELAAQKKAVVATRKLLEQALSSDDPSALPLCESFCTREVGQGRGKPRKLVAECKWFEHCKPAGRYEAVHNPPTKFTRAKSPKLV